MNCFLAEWSIVGWDVLIFGIAIFGVTMLFSKILNKIFDKMWAFLNNSEVDIKTLILILDRIEARQIVTLDSLRSEADKVDKIMATLNEWLDTVLAKVTETDGKADSLIVLFKELQAKIEAGLNLTPEQETKLQAIVDEVSSQAAEIDTAINATPTEPPVV